MELIAEKIENELHGQGIAPFKNSNIDYEYLTLPKDLTTLPTADISKYLNAFTQQKMYVRTVMARSRALYREAKSSFDKEKCKVFKSLPPRTSVTEKELKVFEDLDAENARKRMEFALEKFDYLKDVLDSYEDGRALISRELSRRISAIQEESRDSRFNA